MKILAAAVLVAVTIALAVDVRAEDAGAAAAAHVEVLPFVKTLLDDPKPEVRRGAAKSIADAGPGAVDAAAAELAKLRKAPDDPIAATMTRVGRGDALEALVAEGNTGDPGWAPSLETLALIRLLANVGTTPAARELVTVSLDHQGAFKGEVTRVMRAMGERSVAALIEARANPDARRWAVGLLESMDKKLPGEAVATKSNQVLADVLVAYGTIKDADALGVVFAFIASERQQVRDAARQAVIAYGPMAMGKLREGYANLVGRAPPEEWDAERLARELFKAYDHSRLSEVYATFDAAMAKANAGETADAVHDLDRVLARTPDLDRRIEAVPVYVQYAQSIEDSDRKTALAYYRKAQRLDPDGPRKDQIASAITYLDALELAEYRGYDDVDALKRAAALDPGNPKPRLTLDRIEAASAARKKKLDTWTLIGGAAFVVLASAILFLRARRR